MKCQIQHHQSTSRQASIDCCRGSGSLLPGGLFTFGVSRVARTISQPSAAKRIGLNAEVCRPRTHLFQFGEILSRARGCNRREFEESRNAGGVPHLRALVRLRNCCGVLDVSQTAVAFGGLASPMRFSARRHLTQVPPLPGLFPRPRSDTNRAIDQKSASG